MCLAKNIRYLRKKKNLSQDQIAEQLGYKSYTTIQKWETGISEPPISKLRALSELLGVDINDLASKDLATEDDSTWTRTHVKQQSSYIRIRITKSFSMLLEKSRKRTLNL